VRVIRTIEDPGRVPVRGDLIVAGEPAEVLGVRSADLNTTSGIRWHVDAETLDAGRDFVARAVQMVDADPTLKVHRG
jgi:hypothetical protein